MNGRKRVFVYRSFFIQSTAAINVLSIPETKVPGSRLRCENEDGDIMKDLDKFNAEERGHLNYLGSMLSRPNAPFEDEVQRILDLAHDSEAEGPREQEKQIDQEEAGA